MNRGLEAAIDGGAIARVRQSVAVRLAPVVGVEADEAEARSRRVHAIAAAA